MNIYKIAFLLVFSSFMACQQVPESAMTLAADFAIPTNITELQCQAKIPAPASNLVFQSADGGQTWQDISLGLPENLETGGVFTYDGGLYLRAKNGMYRSNTATDAPVWAKETLPGARSTAVLTGSTDSTLSINARNSDRSTTVFPGRNKLLAFNAEGRFFQKMKGPGTWLPMFFDFKNQSLRTIFETSDGTLFVGCDNGIFKSVDQGKTWKHVLDQGWVIEMVESGGVLLCTNTQGILRSTDNGENWEVVVSEGGVGIAVEVVGGGFAAITYNTESKTRRIRTSTDGGKTWQPIDAGLPPSADIASIKQVGSYLFCGHPEGIFRSSDWGKTWVPVLSSIGKKVFNLSVSGNMIYAVPREGGC